MCYRFVDIIYRVVDMFYRALDHELTGRTYIFYWYRDLYPVLPVREP